MSEVCVDAGLVVKLVTNEEDSNLADILFSGWKQDGTKMVAPVFQPAEVDSVLRNKVRRELISRQAADDAFQLACNLPIELISSPTSRRRAWEMAFQFGLPTVYDAIYLALRKKGSVIFGLPMKLSIIRLKTKSVLLDI